MANRTHNLSLITTLLLAIMIISLPYVAMAVEEGQLDNPPSSNVREEITFSIEANDQEVLAGQVYFIVSSLQALPYQPIVFILSVDGTIVRQVSLSALSATRRHWQIAFDTSQIPNGSYHLVVGRLQADWQLEIWKDAGWQQFFNIDSPKVEPAPSKIFILPETSVPTTLVSNTSTATTSSSLPTITTPTEVRTSIAPSTPQLTHYCQEHGVTTIDQCSILELRQRYPECQTAGLWQLAECQNYLERIYFAQACEPERITNMAQCRLYWQQAVSQHVSCQLPLGQCQEAMVSHLGEVVAHWIVSQKAETILAGLTDRVISFKSLQQGLSSHGIATNVSMIQSFGFLNQPGLRLLPAESAMTIGSDTAMISGWPAVIIIDTDGDRLSDDAEIRYGTKKDQPDTDGDGYLDGDEVEHRFNPLGSGALIAPLEPVDSLIFSAKTWQQPLQSSDQDPNLTIGKVVPFPNGKGVVISGQAQTLQTVTLFIYGSQIPLVVTARADEQGAWKYYLSQPLVDGRYTLYATVMSAEGQIMAKSEAKAVLVKSNQPVTPLEFVQEQPKVLGLAFVNLPSSPIILMIIGSLIATGGILLFIGWLVSRRAH